MIEKEISELCQTIPPRGHTTCHIRLQKRHLKAAFDPSAAFSDLEDPAHAKMLLSKDPMVGYPDNALKRGAKAPKLPLKKVPREPPYPKSKSRA